LLQTAGLFTIYYVSGKDATRSTKDGVANPEGPDVDEEMTATQLHDKNGSLDVAIVILCWL
jgi:hypothetical protein